MKEEFRLQEPQVYGSRTIIPVVVGISACHDQGMMASLRPVALVIGEGATWGIALLEGDSIAAVVEKILLPV
jgi:hypothetical protein